MKHVVCIALAASALGAAVPGAPAIASSAPVLRAGSHGSAVRDLQRRLGLPADGVFGRRTARAVRRFQRLHDLPVTGRVDAATRAALGLAVARAEPLRTGGALAEEPVTSPGPLPAAADLPPDGGQRLLAAARSALGRPYAAGAAGPDAFDCSGLVAWAGAAAGVELPRSSFAQFQAGAPVEAGRIQAGDLVFFDTAGDGPSDVGIASGPATAISATTHGVREHELGGSYWGAHFVGARRLG